MTSDFFFNMREDIKGQYDQARVLMKLNQQLRNRLLQQVKQSKQILNQTKRQKDKLVQRLEIQSKDFQSDLIPNRLFDFIKHDRQVQSRSSTRNKKKSLAKQYLDRSKPFHFLITFVRIRSQ